MIQPFIVIGCRYIILMTLLIVSFALMLSMFHHRCNLRGVEPYTMKILGIQGNAVNAAIVRSILGLFSLYPMAMRLDAKSRILKQKNNPPRASATAFLGDSTFNYWVNLSKDIPESFNASFGGSRSIDLLNFMDDTCLKWYPSDVILHVGGNDWDLRDTKRTHSNIMKIIQRIESAGSRAIIFFSPRAPLYSDNKWIFMSGLRDTIKSHKVCKFIDMSSEKLPLSSYIGDGVHFSSSGYRRLTTTILEHLS